MNSETSLFSHPRWFILSLAILLIVGSVLRIYPSAKFQGMGFDENLYRKNVERMKVVGLLGYPDIIDVHLEEQRATQMTLLPPTRFLYICSGYLWSTVFHVES